MKLIYKLAKHSIYYVSDNNIKYYINIPHLEFINTNISLEFLENTSKYDPDTNDFEWVKNNIVEYYSQIDDDNITLVMPLLRDEEKKLLLSLNVNKLNYIERIMALYINSSYLCLVKNNISVNQEVFLIENNKFQNFIRYFKEQHNSRIIVKGLIEVKNDAKNNKDEVDEILNEKNNIESNLSVDNKSNQNDNVVLPFSLNENALNNVIQNDIAKEKSNVIDNINQKIDSTIINNVPIIDKNENLINSNDKEISKVSVQDNNQIANLNNMISNGSDKIITLNNNLNNEDSMTLNEVDGINSSNNIKETDKIEQVNEIKEEPNMTLDINKTNAGDLKSQKVTSIFNPNNNVNNQNSSEQLVNVKTNNIVDTSTSVPNNVNVQPVNVVPNNIVVPASGILDLNNLTSNGGIPNNVTINIQKLVTDDAPKKSKIEDDEADEIGELDEDIEDIEDFDENEDFDIDAVDVSEAVLSNDDGNKKYRTISSGGVKFVIGRKDDKDLQPIEIHKPETTLDSNSLNINMPTNIVKGDDQINKNAGFASYFTLFFVAISAIFMIVYIIIK